MQKVRKKALIKDVKIVEEKKRRERKAIIKNRYLRERELSDITKTAQILDDKVNCINNEILNKVFTGECRIGKNINLKFNYNESISWDIGSINEDALFRGLIKNKVLGYMEFKIFIFLYIIFKENKSVFVKLDTPLHRLMNYDNTYFNDALFRLMSKKIIIRYDFLNVKDIYFLNLKALSLFIKDGDKT